MQFYPYIFLLYVYMLSSLCHGPEHTNHLFHHLYRSIFLCRNRICIFCQVRDRWVLRLMDRRDHRHHDRRCLGWSSLGNLEEDGDQDG
ncbi:hypothetical protein BKA69DRAFT_1071949, partial [Paraphysoderma sedebokerense]